MLSVLLRGNTVADDAAEAFDYEMFEMAGIPIDDAGALGSRPAPETGRWASSCRCVFLATSHDALGEGAPERACRPLCRRHSPLAFRGIGGRVLIKWLGLLGVCRSPWVEARLVCKRPALQTQRSGAPDILTCIIALIDREREI